MITVSEVTNNPKGLNDFINFPYTLYKDDSSWVAPLLLERKEFFNTKKNPFFDHAEVAFFVAYKNDIPVGRITAHIDENYNSRYGINQGFFGFFESEENYETAASLVEAAKKWLKEKNCPSAIGPMNFSTNHEIGFLLEGFDRSPVVMMTYTKKYYPGFFERMGFEIEKILNAYYLEDIKQPPEIVSEYAEKLKNKFGKDISIRHMDFKNMKNDLDIILEIFNEAWSSNWGFVPMTEAEIEQMAKELKLIADPNITYILYKNNEPAAFLVGIPDVNQALLPLKNGKLFPFGIFKLLTGLRKITTVRVLLMGVKPKFRLLGLDFLMYNEIFSYRYKQKKSDFRNVEMSWILEDNKNMNSALVRMGANLYKKYVVYKKSLHL